ncbi:MAG: methytransferase partner Trm112 [Methanomassiliicoccales archaeon]
MKRELLDILACPVCKHHPLELEVEKKEKGDIVEGRLRCPRCDIDYPIEESIPNLLPPEDG